MPVTGEQAPPWDALPTPVLVSVFDHIFTCPTAHPSYLKQKAQWFTNLRRVCKAWKEAAEETPIGVCLPAQLPKPACDFVCSVVLRGIEWHDPEHTDAELVGLLADPRLVARSGKSIQSIIDAPYNGVWQPTNFPHMTQLVVWRYGHTSRCFDMGAVAGMHQLSYLVLASGFNSLCNTEAWPSVCKHLVITNPTDAHRSQITLPALPKHVNLHWVSLRAYAVRLLDISSVLGHCQQLNIHACYILLRLPPSCFPSSLLPPKPAATQLPQAPSSSSLASTSAQQPDSPRGSSRGTSSPTLRAQPEANWPEEGLQSVASMLVNEHSMLSIRMKFTLVMISPPSNSMATEGGAPPSSGPGDDRGQGSNSQSEGSEGWETASETEASQGEASVAEDGETDGQAEGSGQEEAEGTARRPRMCRHCGRPRRRGRGRGGGGGGDEPGSDGDEDEEEDLYGPDSAYQEMQICQPLSYNQVATAFRRAVDLYAESVRARKGSISQGGASDPLSPVWPTRDAASVGCHGGCGMDTIPAFVIPTVELGKYQPGAERELYVSRKWADPREPARLRLDQPGGSEHMTFAVQRQQLLRSKQPIQALMFSPWPYTGQMMERLSQQFKEFKTEQLVQATQAVVEQPLGGLLSQPDQQALSQSVGQRGQKDTVAAAVAGLSGAAAPAGSQESPPAAAAAAASDQLASQLQSLHVGEKPVLARAASTKSGPAATPQELLLFAASVQHQFLSDARILESSMYMLRKVNYLLLPMNVLPAPRAQALLAPFANLTKISLVLMEAAATYDTPIFPLSVVKVGLYATHLKQHFDSRMVSNLTEMWRLILTGFYSFDFSKLPAMRPGFILKVCDVAAARKEPFGTSGVDMLLPRGRVVDMALQIGTDNEFITSAYNATTADGPAALPQQPLSALPVSSVDLTTWAPLVRDLHVRSPAGVELHAPGLSSLPDFFKMLSKSGMQQLTITLRVDESGTIAAGPTHEMPATNGVTPPVFALVMGSIRQPMRLHGMAVAMLVREQMVPGWGLEVSSGEGAIEQEPGMLYITFYRTSGEAENADAAHSSSSQSPTHSSGDQQEDESLMYDLD